MGLWRCENCGDGVGGLMGAGPAWRWAGDRMQHKCPGSDPQAGHFDCRWFGEGDGAPTVSNEFHKAADIEVETPITIARLAELERLMRLPAWIIGKLKTLGVYYEPPTDSRDVVGEIQGWMHKLCFHYVQNRREVKEYD